MLAADGVPSPDLLSLYAEALRTHPLATKAATAGLTAALGDAIAQRSLSRDAPFRYDGARGVAFVAFGALYSGAFQHVWFSWLNEALPARLASLPAGAALSPGLQAAAKVALNQFVVVPALYMPLFLGFTGALAGLDLDACRARAQQLYAPLLRRNYAFWIPMQFLLFSVVPAEFQIPVLNAAGVLWTFILSSVGWRIQVQTAAALSSLGEIGLAAEELPKPTVNGLTDSVRLEDVASAVNRAVGSVGPSSVTEAAGAAVAAGVGIALGTPEIAAAIAESVNAAELVGVAAILGGTAELVAASADSLIGESTKQAAADEAVDRDESKHIGLSDEGNRSTFEEAAPATHPGMSSSQVL